VSDRDDQLSWRERDALDQWRVPTPSDDFSARVLARLDGERATPRAVRQLAVAALAVMLGGGFFALRLMSSGASTFGPGPQMAGDGGSSLEVHPTSDGLRS
jgi:hypothetical protein